MSPTKYLLICTYVFALIPFLVFLGEGKCEDPNRSPGRRRFLRLVRVMWGLALVALMMVDYRVISQKDKSPAFRFYLNGLPLTNNTCITIPTTNDYVKLEFDAYNVGDSEAEDLQFLAAFPRALNIIPTGTWHETWLFETNRTEPLRFSDDHAFMISMDASSILPISNALHYVGLTLPCSNLHNTFNVCGLKATAKHNVASTIHYMLHITNGVGGPYIGY